MVLYQCPRCRYETTHKPSMRNHYSRKTVCKTAFSRKSVKDCLQDLESKGGMKMSEEIEELKIKNEEEIMKIFNSNFIHRKDIGKEYFQGDTVKMMKEIIGVAYQF